MDQIHRSDGYMALKRERNQHGWGEPAKPWKVVCFIHDFDEKEMGPPNWNGEVLDVTNNHVVMRTVPIMDRHRHKTDCKISFYSIPNLIMT